MMSEESARLILLLPMFILLILSIFSLRATS